MHTNFPAGANSSLRHHVLKEPKKKKINLYLDIWFISYHFCFYFEEFESSPQDFIRWKNDSRCWVEAILVAFLFLFFMSEVILLRYGRVKIKPAWNDQSPTVFIWDIFIAPVCKYYLPVWEAAKNTYEHWLFSLIP